MCALDYMARQTQDPRPKLTWMAIWSLAIPCFLSAVWGLLLAAAKWPGPGLAGAMELIGLCVLSELFIYLGVPLAIYLGVLAVVAAYHGRPNIGGLKIAYAGIIFSIVLLIAFMTFQRNSSLPFLPLLGS